MKKQLSVFFAFALIVSLSGCELEHICMEGTHKEGGKFGECVPNSRTPDACGYPPVNCLEEKELEGTAIAFCQNSKCGTLECLPSYHRIYNDASEDGVENAFSLRCEKNAPQKCGNLGLNCIELTNTSSALCDDSGSYARCVGYMCPPGTVEITETGDVNVVSVCVSSDVFNCVDENQDAIDCTKQPISANALVMACEEQKCVIKTCKSGFHLEDGECKADSINACGPRKEDCTQIKHASPDDVECTVFGCAVKKCETDYHVYANQCVHDTVESCGSHGNNCLSIPNAVSADCEQGKCARLTCASGYEYNSDKAACVNGEFYACGPQKENCGNIENATVDCKDNKCTIISCHKNYHLNETKDKCLPDTPESCGEKGINCNLSIQNAISTACEDGTCVATECNAGHVIIDKSLCMCVDSDCRTCSNINCIDGQSCVNGECIDNECIENSIPKVCDEGQYCIKGECKDDGCELVTCNEGYKCIRALCVEENCIDKVCPQDQTCSNGECIDIECINVECEPSMICKKGNCIYPSCDGLTCSEGKLCNESGECNWPEGDMPALFVHYQQDEYTSEDGIPVNIGLYINHPPKSEVTVVSEIQCESPYTEVELDVSNIVFNEDNYDKLIFVTAKGAADNVVDQDWEYTITFKTVSEDPEFNGLENKVTLYNKNIDASKIDVDKEELFTSEDGGTDSFTIRLGSKPTQKVTFKISSSNPEYGNIDGADADASYTFDISDTDWNIPKTITVKGVDDGESVNNTPHEYDIVFENTISEDPIYNDNKIDPIHVINNDNDKAGVFVNVSNIETSENNENVDVLLTLGSAPTQPINIIAKLFDENKQITEDLKKEVVIYDTETDKEVDYNEGYKYKLTSSNYKDGMKITLRGKVDNVVDNNKNFFLNLYVDADTSNADEYKSIEPLWIPGINHDLDIASIIINGGGNSIKETDANANNTKTAVTIQLSSKPIKEVTLSIVPENASELSVSPAQITITDENWNKPQTVTIQGKPDESVDGNQNVKINVNATSEDTNYNGKAASFNITVVDTNKAGILHDENPKAFHENVSTESDKFTIKLTSKPSDNVTLKLASTDSTELSVSPTSLTFSPTTWNSPKEVTVKPVDDLQADGTQTAAVKITAQSTDKNYNNLSAQTNVWSILDNDSASLALTSSTNELGANGKATLTITLGSQPTKDVTVTLSSSPSAFEFSKPAVAFTTNDYNPKTIIATVSASYHSNATITITATATSKDSSYNNRIVSVPITVTTVTAQTFNYTGSVQQTTLSKGTYRITAYGAQGGSAGTAAGGKGAKVSGILTLSNSTTLYLYVGGAGKFGSIGQVEGGWNGGGTITKGKNTATGGGASDVALSSGDGNTHLCSRILVAGGGGGALYNSKPGGYGGGYIGGDGSGDDPGYGGTLSSGGKLSPLSNQFHSPAYSTAMEPKPGFGIGGGIKGWHDESYGSGGGGWYGGSAGTWYNSNGSGGGGSSFVYSSSLSASYPSSCKTTPAASYKLTSISASSNNKTGNGQIVIEPL